MPDDDLLNRLAETIAATPLDRRVATERAWNGALSLISAQAAAPRALQWYLETRSADGTPREDEDFWASRIGREAAQEIATLAERIVVLYAEHRRCDLVGNSAAAWDYATFAVLPRPLDEAARREQLHKLFAYVADSERKDHSSLNMRSDRLAPDDAILTVCYEHELPDARMGHSMMRLDCSPVGSDAVQYWPSIDDAEYNYVDAEALLEVRERLGLRHILPMQLAALLCVLGSAHGDGTESWGGARGLWFFEEGNIPYTLRHLADE